LWLLLKSDVQCFTTSFTWHEFSLELFLVSIFEEQSINHALLFIFLIEIEKESYLVKNIAFSGLLTQKVCFVRFRANLSEITFR
jgi:hypothetical protein